MADIKTKNRIQHTIKSLDMASIAQDKMKQAYAKTKEIGRDDSASPSAFAEEKASSAARTATAKAANTSIQAGNLISEKAMQELKTRDIKKRFVSQNSKTFSSNEAARTSSFNQVRKNVHVRNRQMQLAKKRTTERLVVNNFKEKSRLSARFGKKMVSYLVRSVKAIISSTKALITALAAGGWIAVLVVVICIMFGAGLYFFGDESSNSYTSVSAEVEAYSPIISKYAEEYGIGEYTELIKAVMMQESGGKGKDPMQSSESGYNTKYSRKPNSITDPEYSIKCGVQALAASIKQAKCSNPLDMEHISLALQGYNYGNGYIAWAVKKYGGYSKANALEFSKAQAKKQGWSSYGDPEYVDHVLRYYPYGNFSYDIVNTGPGKLGLPIKGMTKSNISSYYGPRSSPGGIGSSNHKGIDIAFPTGTQVLACESGTVTTAGWNGGYGNCIIIDHGGGVSTIYGHLSSIGVKKGQKVLRGQVIGKVGSTGNSTGPHLHLGVTVNGAFQNPLKGWISLN